MDSRNNECYYEIPKCELMFFYLSHSLDANLIEFINDDDDDNAEFVI